MGELALDLLPLSPEFTAGEGGIWTLSGPLDSVSYRFHIATGAALARAAVAPCTLSHAVLKPFAGEQHAGTVGHGGCKKCQPRGGR